MLSTIEAEFKIRKSVPLHTTLRIECEVIACHTANAIIMGMHGQADSCPPMYSCPQTGRAVINSAGKACVNLDNCLQIKEIKGMRCWVHGCILDSNRNVLATCVAQLVDLQRLWAAQGS